MGVTETLRSNTRVKIKKNKKLSRGVALQMSFKEKAERGLLGEGVGGMSGHPKDMPEGPRLEIASLRKIQVIR